MSAETETDSLGGWLDGMFLLTASVLAGAVVFWVVGGGAGVLPVATAVGGSLVTFLALSYLQYGR